MHKTVLLSLFSVGLVAAVVLVPASALAVQGDPIPGVDVSVEQSPSGIKVGSVQTNASGTFTVGHLRPGQYVVKFTPPKPKPGVTQNYNSSKSNTAGIIAPDGSTVVNITIDLFATEKGTPSQPISVTIGAKGGTIKGTVMEGAPDENFFQRLRHAITDFIASVTGWVRHPFGGSSPSAGQATPTPSPTQSPTSTPTPTATPKTSTPTQAQPTPTATSSPSTTSTSSPTASGTPTPTPNTDVTLISVYPRSVSAGDQFAINGTYFLVGRTYIKQVSAVMVGGVSTAFTIIDGQTIFVTAQGEPGVYDISIVTTAGKTLTLNAALTIH